MAFSLDPLYQRRHRSVIAARGKANEHDCVDCNRQIHNSQWSERYDGDPDNVWDYDPRCPACHSKYDRLHGSKHGHQKLTEEDIREIRKKCSSKEWTQAEAASIKQVARPTIHKIVNRCTWKWVMP